MSGCVWVFHLHVCLCTPWCSTQGGQRRVLDSLERELQTVVSHHAGTEPASLQQQPVLLVAQPSLQLHGCWSFLGAIFLQKPVTTLGAAAASLSQVRPGTVCVCVWGVLLGCLRVVSMRCRSRRTCVLSSWEGTHPGEPGYHIEAQNSARPRRLSQGEILSLFASWSTPPEDSGRPCVPSGVTADRFSVVSPLEVRSFLRGSFSEGSEHGFHCLQLPSPLFPTFTEVQSKPAGALSSC